MQATTNGRTRSSPAVIGGPAPRGGRGRRVARLLKRNAAGPGEEMAGVGEDRSEEEWPDQPRAIRVSPIGDRLTT
jgi:hypothetical protein